MKVFLSIFVFLFLAVHSHADIHETLKRAKQYYYGAKEVSKDYSQAKKYFLEAADNNSAEAYRYLGVMYLFGHGTVVDHDQAKMWLNKAIALGDDRSQKIYDKYLGSKESQGDSEKKLAQNDISVVIKKTYYPSGKLKSETPYKNGKKIGISKEYYKNGELASEIPYVNGKEEGIAKVYYENGRLKFKTHVMNGKREGIQKWYRENGKLWVETFYRYGKKWGIEKVYDENGEFNESPFVNGRREGIAKNFYKNGRLKIETPYVDGKIEGIVKVYDMNGKLRKEIPYVNGVEIEDAIKEYDVNGKFKRKMLDDNKLPGFVNEYYKNSAKMYGR